MISLLRRPGVVFHVFLAAFALWLGWGWLAQGPSGGELLFQLGKAADFEQGCRSVHGIAWWTPAYMQGHSLAEVWSAPLATLALELGRLLIHGIAGYKVVGLLGLVAAGVAMYRFVADFTGNAATAAWAGAFYVLGPELSVRLAETEHLATALCFPLAPLLFHQLWKLRRRGAARDVLLLALVEAAMLLTFTKMAFLFLPALAAFAVWLARGDAAERRRFLFHIGAAMLLTLPLAALPLLPLWREQHWMTLFSHDPMAAWQHSFVVFSALAWWDRDGALLAAAGPAFGTGRSFYLGLVGGTALAVALIGPGPLRGWRGTQEGRRCLLFVGIALLLEWISHGPISVAGGFLATLKGSAPLPSWAIALLWLAFAGQLVLVFLLSGLATGRLWLRLGAMAVYLFLPLFVLFEKLPLYGELRAPGAIWSLGGSFCVAVAAALALQAILERLPVLKTKTETVRLAAGWLAIAAALADFSPYHAAFREGALPNGVYADFLRAADFLRQDATPGSIFPVSGRYFYLELPTRAGRALWNEAATSYLQPRWTRELVEAGRVSPQALGEALAAGGVGFVLLDKGDPEQSPELTAFLRNRYPVAFENTGFAVLRCPGSTAPALATGRAVPASEPLAFPAMLEASASDVWPIAPGLRAAGPPPAPASRPPAPSAILSLRQPRFADYHTIRLDPAPAAHSWVIVPEAYHPDWHAEADGKEIPVYRALGCYLAACAPRDGAAVTFRFRPPWWYSAVLALAALTWVGTAAAAFLLRPRP